MAAPSVTNAAAVLQSRNGGSASGTRSSQFISIEAVHSLGSSGCAGARSTMMNSTRFWNPSGRASCSGWAKRRNSTTPPSTTMPRRLSTSRARRAGKMFTSASVTIVPMTAGSTRNGTSAASATSGKSQPPSKTMPYAVRIGTIISPTIHEEWIVVSASLVR